MTDSARAAEMWEKWPNAYKFPQHPAAHEVITMEFAEAIDADVVKFAEAYAVEVRESTAREIADWLDADAPTHDDGMYGGIATETLRQAAKKIREKYGVTP